MGILDDLKKLFGGAKKEEDDRASLSKKVQANPNDANARHGLGRCLLLQGATVEGLDQLARAAVLFEKEGFGAKAVAVLRQMVKADPGNLDFQRWFIRLMVLQGIRVDAQLALEALVSKPNSFPDDDKRLEFFQKLGNETKSWALPRLLAFDVHCARKSMMDALAELEGTVCLAVEGGMTAEFAKRVSSLIALAPEDLVVLEPCAFLFYRIGDLQHGEALFAKIGPMVADQWPPQKAAEVEKVIDSIRNGWHPGQAEATSFVDALRKIEGRGRSATRSAVDVPEAPQPPPKAPESIQLTDGHPDEPSARVAQPSASRSSDDADGIGEEEESLVRRALGQLQAKVDEEIGQDDLEARYNLGIAYKEMGLLDEAASEFRMARRDSTLYLGASSLLADTLAVQGNIDEAADILDKILALGNLSDETSRDVRYHKAEILEGAGRKQAAEAIYRVIFLESPEYRDIRKKLDE